jgi:hypothetical protein
MAGENAAAHTSDSPIDPDEEFGYYLTGECPATRGGSDEVSTTGSSAKDGASMTAPDDTLNDVMDGNPGAEWYGARYWIAELVSGGLVSLNANRVEIASDGTLVFYGGGHHPRADQGDKPDYDRPRGDDYPMLAFAAGQWRIFYAAKVVDGSPLSVDRWKEPT